MTWFWRWLWRREKRRGDVFETCEATQPWLVYGYFTPRWVEVLLGRIAVRQECCICGAVAYPVVRYPRFGLAEEGGAYPVRHAFMVEHLHPAESGNVFTWVKPLRSLLPTVSTN